MTAIGAKGVPRRVPGHAGSLSVSRFSRRDPRQSNGIKLRETIGDKDMNIAISLERALHLKAVIKIEEEEQTNVIRVCFTNKTKCFNVELLLNGKSVRGLLDSGSSILLISFDTYEQLGKPGSMKAFNIIVLAANNSALKIVGSVDIKIQMKPKSGDFVQEFLITADNCLPCIFGWDFKIDQELILNIGEKIAIQYETSDNAIYISTINDRSPHLCNSRGECKNPQQT